MKTIQEHFKECNREAVIEAHLNKYISNKWLFLDKNMTLKEHEEVYVEKLNKLIDRLISVEPSSSDETMIFLATHCYPDESGEDIRIMLLDEKELDNEWVQSYGYEFVPFEKAVTYYVADTYLTQYELNELLAEFLYEISWTGYEQEHLEETLASLDKSIEETKRHKDDPDYFMSHEEFIRRLEESLGIELEKTDPEQEEAWHEVIKHVSEYNVKCQKIEIAKLKKLLKTRNKKERICFQNL